MKVVIVPYISDEKVKELKQCKIIKINKGDLWGPFIMCMILGL